MEFNWQVNIINSMVLMDPLSRKMNYHQGKNVKHMKHMLAYNRSKSRLQVCNQKPSRVHLRQIGPNTSRYDANNKDKPRQHKVGTIQAPKIIQTRCHHRNVITQRKYYLLIFEGKSFLKGAKML